MLHRLTPSARLHAVTIVTAAGLVAGMVISLPVWMGGRAVPHVPWVEGLPFLRAPWDTALLGALAGALLTAVIRARHWPALWAGVVICLAIGVQDVLRAQPWFFEYVLILWLLAARALAPASAEHDARTLRALGWLFAAVYVYSGVSKFNDTYVHEVVPLLIQPFVTPTTPPADAVTAFAWASVVIETLIGLAFLHARTRRAAVIAVTLMHAGILACLGPWGLNDNAVVWPWNAVMIVHCWLVVWPRADVRSAHMHAPDGPSSARVLGVWQSPALIAGCVLPALGIVHAWPAYLSWNMYTGGEPEIVLGLTPAAALEAPESLKPLLQPLGGANLTDAVALSRWVGALTRARVMPEEWYLRALCTRVLGQFPGVQGVVVVDLPRAPRWRPRGPDGALPERPKTQVRAGEFLTRQPRP